MKTTVIAAFPGTGKSYFVASLSLDSKAIDLDTNEYTKGYDKHEKPVDQKFPYNYLAAIKQTIGETNYFICWLSAGRSKHAS